MASFLKILSVALITATVTCSILGTLRRQMWPAGPVAILVLSAWFYHSASPWFIPVAVDRWPIDLTILHVEKRGLQFHETAVSLRTYRANRFQVDHNDRRLFQYSFMSQGTRGVLPDILLESANELAHSTKIVNLRTAPPVSLRSWNAEGWYVSVTGTPLLAFTSEYSTNPPQEIKEIFEQIQKLPGSAPFSFLTQDVCLGFCYDPTAGLGLRYANNRCHQVAGEPFECH